LVLLGIIAGIVCATMLCVAGNVSTILFKQVRDAYILYRVTNERDTLRAALRDMEEEVVALRLARSNERVIEGQLHAQVNALKDVLSLAGSLGLVNRVEGRPARDRYVTDGELSRLARSLAGAKRSVSTGVSGVRDLAQVRSINQGLGGAEVECRRSKLGEVQCRTEGRDVQLVGDGPVSGSAYQILERVAAGGLHSGVEQQQALQILPQIISVLKILPIGSPVAGELTSGFGHRHSPFSHRSSFHEGVDISLARGRSVVATADGVVSKVDFDRTYGWMVDVEHTPDLVTRYAHLSRPLVKEGSAVARGDAIALSGSTGRSTGPHLHYEVRYRNVARDPKPFLALADKLRSFS
jgi:murein DD-endopeptidase MepM/ murein hydrolase activator NlpD